MWSSVVVTFAFLVSIAIYLQNYWSKYFCEECENPTTVGDILKAFYFFLYIMSVFYVIMVICLFKDQEVPIAMFKVTTKVMSKNLRMMFVPTVLAGVIVGYILYWFYTFALLYTTPTLIVPTDYQQQKGLDYTDK